MPSSNPTYLLDVNILIALLATDHVHRNIVMKWFKTEETQWALCPFTEAGFLRLMTAPGPGQITMNEASDVLESIAKRPQYHYVPLTSDWRTLTKPFSPRVHGTKQVTDAYLLGLAIQNNLVLATMDKGIVHLAGSQYKHHVLLLAAN